MNKLQLNSLQKQYATKATEYMTGIVKNSVGLGQLLTKAKSNLNHGEFIPMLENIGLAERTAQRYMNLGSLSIVSNTTNLSLLENFNNSQLKKLDKMPEPEALAIIESGEFPKQSKAPKEGNVIDVEPEEHSAESFTVDGLLKSMAHNEEVFEDHLSEMEEKIFFLSEIIRELIPACERKASDIQMREASKLLNKDHYKNGGSYYVGMLKSSRALQLRSQLQTNTNKSLRLTTQQIAELLSGKPKQATINKFNKIVKEQNTQTRALRNAARVNIEGD